MADIEVCPCCDKNDYLCYVWTDYLDEFKGWCPESINICYNCTADKDLTHRNGQIVCKECLTMCNCCTGDRPNNIIQIGQHEWRCEDCIDDKE